MRGWRTRAKERVEAQQEVNGDPTNEEYSAMRYTMQEGGKTVSSERTVSIVASWKQIYGICFFIVFVLGGSVISIVRQVQRTDSTVEQLRADYVREYTERREYEKEVSKKLDSLNERMLNYIGKAKP